MFRGIRSLLIAGAIVIATSPSRAKESVTVYRDRFGTPSIVGAGLADGAYGLGYCMATDGAERMSRNYHQARGRSAEIDGRSAVFSDLFVRSLGMERLAIEHSTHLTPIENKIIGAFCAGANRAITEQRSRLPDWVEPVGPVDVLSLEQFVNSAFPLIFMARDLFSGRGSNQFALSPAHTTTHRALLSMDPHLEWDGPFAWYEYAVYAGDLRFHGVTLYGLPVGVMGHGDRVAWSMTNNSPKLYDLFKVETSPLHPGAYNFHGAWRAFETETDDIRFRVNGVLHSEPHTVKMTAWGPMAPFHNDAASFSTLGTWQMLEQGIRMAEARDAHAFRDALKLLGLSMWNIVYADTHGTIAYQYNARVPRRSIEFDWSKPVSGADPKTAWGALWKLDELPRIVNPGSGILVNCNTAPELTTTDNEMRGQWPPYVTSFGHTTRYDRLSTLLKGDGKISPETAMRYATDTLVPYARETVAALTQLTGVDGAIGLLQRWSLRCDSRAVGCGLYYYWLGADKACPSLSVKAGRGESWSVEEAETARKALESAEAAMRRDHESLDIPWGAMHYSAHGSLKAPVSGFHFDTENLASVSPNTGAFRSGEITCSVGSSFRMIVDLNPQGIRSWSVLPYGDSQVSGSRHYGDQMELFGRGGYKDTHFGLERARLAAVSKQTL